MKIKFSCETIPSVDEVIALYSDARLQRPTHDKERMKKMLSHSNLFVTAWHDDTLIGLARSLTDWGFCCYLSDLAVRDSFKKRGIGKRLIQLTKERIGEESLLLLLAAPTAMEIYPKVGFEKCENSFIIKRKK
jgi:N-acetylglutamate synthase-like GNAT family acetyltransferase